VLVPRPVLKFRLKVDHHHAWMEFLRAQDAVFEVERSGFFAGKHNGDYEEFRWNRGLWCALLDATTKFGIWRYRVESDWSDDCDYIKVVSHDPQVSKIITSKFAENTINSANWTNILRRIRPHA
jgi:hypothetical protein